MRGAAVTRKEPAVPVLYLDLDGTVRQGKDDALGRFVNGPADVVVFPEATEMMRRWKQGGGRIVGVSNQGGVSLGVVSYEKVAAAMRETQRQAGGLFDKIVWCSTPPDSVESARGPQGVFSLPAAETDHGIPGGEDGSGREAFLVPPLRYRLCARVQAAAAGREAGSPRCLEGCDIRATFGPSATGLLRWDHRRRGHDRQDDAAGSEHLVSPDRSDHDARADHQVAGPVRGEGGRAAAQERPAETPVALAPVDICGLRDSTAGTDAIPDHETGDRRGTARRDHGGAGSPDAALVEQHHPAAKLPEFARCWCRKPSPGLLIEAAIDLAGRFGEYYPPYMGLMVGDRPEDEQCAALAGLDFQWAAGWRAQAASLAGTGGD